MCLYMSTITTRFNARNLMIIDIIELSISASKGESFFLFDIIVDILL